MDLWAVHQLLKKMRGIDRPYSLNIHSPHRYHHPAGFTIGILLLENTSYLEQLSCLRWAKVVVNNLEIIKYPTLSSWSVRYHPKLDSFCFVLFWSWQEKITIIEFKWCVWHLKLTQLIFTMYCKDVLLSLFNMRNMRLREV